MRALKGILVLILGLFFFNIKAVSAKNVDIVIDNIKIVSNSETVEYTKPTVKDNKISSEITFNNVNDFITFEVLLKNNESIKYFIEKITDNNKNSNITITYDYGDKEISGNGTKKITIKFLYNKKIEQGEVLSFDDVKITLDLLKENGDSVKTVLNPTTGDNITLYFMLFIISSLVITLLVKNRYVKRISITVLLLLISPKLINATTDEIYEINISFNNAYVNGSAITYSINIDEELTKQENNEYTIIYDANGGTGLVESSTHLYTDEFVIPDNTLIRYGYKFIGWNTKKDGSGKSYNSGERVKSLTKENEITLYANWEDRTNGYTYKGTNTFKGKNNNIEGEMGNNQSIDYLNTGIKPFSEENRSKGFVLSFKISDFDINRTKDKNNLDTIFTIVPNASDISETNPGVTLRLRNGRWIFEVGNEVEKHLSTSFKLEDLIGKEFKLIRINDGKTIKLYYSIDNQKLNFLREFTNTKANDAMISFGATYYDGETGRYFEGKIDDISFKYYDYLTIGMLLADDYDEDLPVVFSAKGPCEFNGPEKTITGESCKLYQNERFINTGISLFSEENYKKDFEISFDILAYNPENQSADNNQQTFMNMKLENELLDYPGIVVRKSGTNIQFGSKDGKGQSDYKYAKYSDVQNVRVVKKDNVIYYSVNGNKFNKLSDMTNFDSTFDIPLYFGASSLTDGTPIRIVKATLANMTIRLGKINKDIV